MNYLKRVRMLRMIRGTTAKLTFLRKFIDDKDWKEYLVFVYQPSINYRCSAPSDVTVNEDPDMRQLLNALQDTVSSGFNGNKQRSLTLAYSRTFGELYRLALGRSLKAGVSITTINKAYPKLIDEFKVMLAENVPIDEIKLPALASIKFDGLRLILMKKRSSITLVTRAGKAIVINSIIKDAESLADGVYDGELVFAEGKQVGRTKITGAANKCLLGTACDIPNSIFRVFDYIGTGDFANRLCSTPYKERYKALFASGILRCENIAIVAQTQVKTHAQIRSQYAAAYASGYEGLIIRYKKDPYVWQRSKKLIKIKAKKHTILTCVGTTEGNGKYEGMIGALICEGTVSGKEVHVKLGTGLSDHDREQAPEHYIHEEMDVEYNDIVRADKADKYSLFLPVFKRIHKRYDT